MSGEQRVSDSEEQARAWGCSHTPACATPEACGALSASTARRVEPRSASARNWEAEVRALAHALGIERTCEGQGSEPGPLSAMLDEIKKLHLDIAHWYERASERIVAALLDQTNSYISNARLTVLAERAGGHGVGAPATRDEERAMALELLRRRRAGAGSSEVNVTCRRCGREPSFLCREHFVADIDRMREAMKTVISAIGHEHQDLNLTWIVKHLREAMAPRSESRPRGVVEALGEAVIARVDTRAVRRLKASSEPARVCVKCMEEVPTGMCSRCVGELVESYKAQRTSEPRPVRVGDSVTLDPGPYHGKLGPSPVTRIGVFEGTSELWLWAAEGTPDEGTAPLDSPKLRHADGAKVDPRPNEAKPPSNGDVVYVRGVARATSSDGRVMVCLGKPGEDAIYPWVRIETVGQAAQRAEPGRGADDYGAQVHQAASEEMFEADQQRGESPARPTFGQLATWLEESALAGGFGVFQTGVLEIVSGWLCEHERLMGPTASSGRTTGRE